VTAPAVPAAETVRAARTTVAVDITKSRRRIAELSAQLRAETQQLANLTAMAEIVGVTAVDSESAPDVIDAAVGKAEAPPAVGTPMGP
jgi:hypothetical protein